MTIELREPFDAATYITDAESQAELISEALASGDSAFVAHALGIVARAQGGIGKLATDSGLGRQALHRALGKGGNPTLETLLTVLGTMHFKLRAEPSAEAV